MTQIPLPTPDGLVDLKNVQGDVIFGLQKNHEHFVLFTITHPAKFKEALPSLSISSSDDVHHAHKKIVKFKQESPGKLMKLGLLNISFSQRGIDALGISDNLGDPNFSKGQRADSQALGDKGTSDDEGKFRPDWHPGYFKRIDGVMLAAGESLETANEKVDEALEALGESVTVVHRLNGKVRDGDYRGHEHFGWLDGISNPAIKGVVDPLPGQGVVEPGAYCVVVVICKTQV
ncbi:hypothetical protein FRC12_025138 [Ceratobasidium sp. 428]|nr:hypothetical protein FRC12_025138 [Ceratobasidium sp. 428]